MVKNQGLNRGLVPVFALLTPILCLLPGTAHPETPLISLYRGEFGWVRVWSRDKGCIPRATVPFSVYALTGYARTTTTTTTYKNNIYISCEEWPIAT